MAVIDGPNAALAATAAAIGATVLVLDERGGPARARNRGARAAGRAILLFVDADVEVPVDLAARVAGFFTAHPEVAAMFGSYDAEPAAPGLVSQFRNLLHHFVHQTARETASTFWAGCGAVRREAFERVGGFDESWTEPSIEDIELGSRLVADGPDDPAGEGPPGQAPQAVAPGRHARHRLVAPGRSVERVDVPRAVVWSTTSTSSTAIA